MVDFEFVSPTKIIFGRKSEEKIADVLKGYGFSKVMLVYGSASIKRTGLYDKIVSLLDEAHIKHEELEGVRANPSINTVLEGLKIAKDYKPDCLLAIGGGSVIDTAKSIGVSYYYKGNPFDFNTHKAKPEKSLPVGVILTLASSGSELSDSCVIQDDESKVKMGFNSDVVRPLFVIEDPMLTYTVPSFQTSCGISDIMMHSLERYFAPSEGDQLADEWALALIKNTMEAGKAALKDPYDYEARAALMLNSSLSHNGLTGIGKKKQFVIHPLEHALSGYSSAITHGAGVALIFPAWAKYVYQRDLTKFSKLGEYLFGIKDDKEEEKAIMGINSMKEFFSSIGMPTTLKEVGLSKEDIPSLVALASGNGTHVIGCYPQSLEATDMEAIYRSLLR